MKRVQRAAVFLLLLSAMGCGGRTTATVSGKVAFKGEPVTAGYIVFYGADGQSVSGRIDADGHYTVYKAPVGEVKVAVLTADPNRKPPSRRFTKGKRSGAPPKGKALSDEEKAAPFQVGKFVALPARYRDPAQSRLTFTVKSGSQTIDLDLEH